MVDVATASGPEDARKGFRLLKGENPEALPPAPVPLAQGHGQPPRKPPAAPAFSSDPEPEKPLNELEARIKELEAENRELLAAVSWLYDQLKEHRPSK